MRPSAWIIQRLNNLENKRSTRSASAIIAWWEFTSAAFAGDIADLVARASQALNDAEARIEVVRMRRGELTSGGEGLALVDSALERIRTLGVKRPDLFVRMLAPFKAG